jgi:hypothetical protein
MRTWSPLALEVIGAFCIVLGAYELVLTTVFARTFLRWRRVYLAASKMGEKNYLRMYRVAGALVCAAGVCVLLIAWT